MAPTFRDRSRSAPWLAFALMVTASVRANADQATESTEYLWSLPPVVEGEAAVAPLEKPPAPASIDELNARLDELEKAEKKREDAAEKKRVADAKRPKVNWSGQVQSDFYWFNQDAASRAEFGNIPNGEAFRRARLGAFGDYGPTEYRIEADFALAGRPSFLDMYGGIHDLPGVGRVRVGHFFEPFSLERITSNRFTTFLERSLLDQAFVPARNTGVGMNNTWLDEAGTWSAGVFRTESDVFGDDVGDESETSLTGRVTALGWYEDQGARLLHLGAAASARHTNDDVARFRAQPEARIGATTPNVPFFVDTGAIPADFYSLAGLEAAWVRGPLSVRSEYVLSSVDADNGSSPTFHGWYAYLSYFLTGEHQPYSRQNGAFDRVIPCRDFVRYAGDPDDGRVCFGPGAWETAVRVSQLDLDDDGVLGGRQTDVTAALNWYLNPYLRVSANYVHAFVTNGGVESQCDIVGCRVGFDF